MPNLAVAVEGRQYTVKGLSGDSRFLSRITSVGLTVGGVLRVVRNAKRMPVLVYARDTMLAIDKKEAANIQVEVSE
ncbi:MAG: ferrous iron transport protein [Clostridiales bacterium]|jgi:ferrous iron transport protein A|nr:ferrous iron transport protein [Clostridiales bacterium]